MSFGGRPKTDYSNTSFSTRNFSAVDLKGDSLSFGSGAFGSILVDTITTFDTIIGTFYASNTSGYVVLNNVPSNTYDPYVGYNYLLVPYYWSGTIWSIQTPPLLKNSYLYYGAVENGVNQSIGLRVRRSGKYEIDFQTYLSPVNNEYTGSVQVIAYINNTNLSDTTHVNYNNQGIPASPVMALSNGIPISCVFFQQLNANDTIMFGLRLTDSIVESESVRLEMFQPTATLKYIGPN